MSLWNIAEDITRLELSISSQGHCHVTLNFGPNPGFSISLPWVVLTVSASAFRMSMLFDYIWLFCQIWMPYSAVAGDDRQPLPGSLLVTVMVT